MSEVTRIIRAISQGQPDSTGRLLPLVYQEMKQMAAARLAGEAAGHTLQPTALVHEAYLRLVGPEDRQWENRAHFFGAAAEAMRRILIDHARNRLRQKRGGGKRPEPLGEVADPQHDDAERLIQLAEAIEALELLDAPKAQLVKLKFFGGMTTTEAADMLGLAQRTAERYWAYARVWLHRHMNENPDT